MGAASGSGFFTGGDFFSFFAEGFFFGSPPLSGAFFSGAFFSGAFSAAAFIASSGSARPAPRSRRGDRADPSSPARAPERGRCAPSRSMPRQLLRGKQLWSR